ncbi:thioredoxin domain-containing protein [Rummeliibacillus sp. NPDC094406]|uniref:thioredoxin domain-containing protein n=1 Tax=Rummeliibacillus sp. NPDC094406 TaxID=3364511 RepID=UPI0037F8E5AB
MPNTNKPNKLIHETSPYLLQHAYNPVNWYPWSEEAFKIAKQEDKPVLVSIGYSTCHWCHVMAHESFEDEEVAALLNELFVCIKVDREERPDIDSIYMNVCQMMTGSGGWPLNVFLTPDQKPFYAGTYFSKHSKYGRPGMLEVIPNLAKVYHEDPEQITTVVDGVISALHEMVQQEVATIPSTRTKEAFQNLQAQFDDIYGGFGTAPKFPTAGQILYLLRYYVATGNENALLMATKTLEQIHLGGIYDHIGFGFARYSTDQIWLVPHFEKMLYDQALLLHCYTEAYQITKSETFKQVVYNTIRFLKREMQHPEGGFYSAIDADSEGVEGKYYLWDYEEILEILGDKQGKVYATTYDITPKGNFEGKNIPNLIETDFHVLSKDELEQCRQKLLQYREKRVYPHVDDKILTAWNTLLISALAKAGAVFEEESFINIAKEIDEFVQKNLVNEGKLLVSYRDGQAKQNAFIDDYANYLWALNELYLATGNIDYIDRAEQLTKEIVDQFHDTENGGFFLTNHTAETLIVREKTALDNAYPAGNSTAAMQLWRLGKLTENEDYIKLADEILDAFSADINRYPSATLWLLQLMLAHQTESREIHLTNPTDEIRSALYSQYRPFDVWHIEEQGTFEMQLCQNYSCQLAITDPTEALKTLQK